MTDAPPRSAPARSSGPLVLGVLGAIASGKSEVARALAGPEGLVVDADQIAHEALERPEVREWLAARFGPQVVREGRVDRAALARDVFGSSEVRRELEARVHPLVRTRIRALVDEARAQARPRVVLDVPLLLENEAQHGLTALCDALVFVDADARLRQRWANARRGWTPDELERRQATQLPLESKRAHADHVVVNDGDLDQLRARTRALLAKIEERDRTR